MLKVLIADDELVVRAGIKSIIDWEGLGLELIGEASSGAEALEIIISQSPDIVLLDIMMPELNGIEVLKSLKEKNIQTAVIILSCYNDFEYVRQAMKLGAVDYLYKLSLKTEELAGLLKDISKKKIISGSTYENTAVNMDNLKIFLEEVFCGVNTFDSGSHEREVRDFLERINNGNNAVSIIKFDNNQKVNKQIMLNSITEILKQKTNNSICKIVLGKITITFSGVKDKSELRHYLKGIENILGICLDTGFSIGTSGIFKSSDNLYKAYTQAAHANAYSFYLPAQSIIYYEETEPHLLKNPVADKNMFKNLRKAVEMHDRAEVSDTINSFFNSINTNKNIDPEIVKNDVIEIVNIFSGVLRLNGFTLRDLNKTFSYSEIMGTKNLSELNEWLVLFIKDFTDFIDIQKKRYIRDEVKILKSYILENYGRELKLSKMAAYVNISANHLCYLFKKETGINLFDYINEIRINEAIQLLRTNKYKVFEVSHMVGFNSASYFTRVFKKITDITPYDFLQKNT